MFDSGVGGLTVLEAIRKRLPHEDLIYLGDTAHVPYGNKSAKTIEQYADANARFLLEKKVRGIVIACNTASAYAGRLLSDRLPVPVIGVVEPGVEAALAASYTRRIAVLATRSTLCAGVYQAFLQKRCQEAAVFPVPCPLFVPLIEEGMAGHAITEQVVDYYLQKLAGSEVDTVLLGCTHYPFLREMIEKAVGKGVQVIDSAGACAEAVASRLGTEKEGKTGACAYYVSDDAAHFAEAAKRLAIPLRGAVSPCCRETAAAASEQNRAVHC